ITDSGSSRNNIGRAVFGASLVHLDRNEVPYGVLAESVPQLNTESWKLLPDGRMETVFRLRPNLTWHDGSPLTAQDFIFARRVNIARIEWGLAINASPEDSLTEEILAPDERTVIFRWRQPYVDGATPALRPEWAQRNTGTVLITPSQIRQLQAQHRADFANPAAVLDVRFRRAVAHALDRQAIADALLEGQGEGAETIAPRAVTYHEEIERTAPKYPYDVRQSE